MPDWWLVFTSSSSALKSGEVVRQLKSRYLAGSDWVVCLR
jgi:hypothetical protein